MHFIKIKKSYFVNVVSCMNRLEFINCEISLHKYDISRSKFHSYNALIELDASEELLISTNPNPLAMAVS